MPWRRIVPGLHSIYGLLTVFAGGQMSLSRRDFLGAGAVVAASLAVPTVADASPQVSMVDRGDLEPRLVARRPIVVCSANGLYRDNPNGSRSEEHTSELQSHSDLVCRLLLEKNKHEQSRRFR